MSDGVLYDNYFAMLSVGIDPNTSIDIVFLVVLAREGLWKEGENVLLEM
jgi:hypothetical protein